MLRPGAQLRDAARDTAADALADTVDAVQVYGGDASTFDEGRQWLRAMNDQPCALSPTRFCGYDQPWAYNFRMGHTSIPNPQRMAASATARSNDAHAQQAVGSAEGVTSMVLAGSGGNNDMSARENARFRMFSALRYVHVRLRTTLHAHFCQPCIAGEAHHLP